MDHSVQAYLQGMSTEKLEGALQHYLREDQIGDHRDAIVLILDELRRRFAPGKPTPQELQVLERHKRRLEESRLL